MSQLTFHSVGSGMLSHLIRDRRCDCRTIDALLAHGSREGQEISTFLLTRVSSIVDTSN
jgi:hypothetical protein